MSARTKGSGPSENVCVRFKVSALGYLDKVRGSMSRSDYVRGAVQRAVQADLKRKGLS